ncbi:hypothetical protein KUTeg_012713 [Tegillarca granosa]|uniref:Major facilitator superfamily (MFS) profile domain-containing protein n=1 Tax=Tegillarca granosa TaxID=220873 RepID=A0ABQ9F0G2_TEGGR|nr:hypothetical protein KUTeg_012713 [Tegillarca granosa]
MILMNEIMNKSGEYLASAAEICKFSRQSPYIERYYTLEMRNQQSKPWIVVIAATLVMLMGASMISGASVIHIALLEYYDRSPVVTTWLGSLFTGMFCFASIIASSIINSFNTRTCIIVGGIINLIGFSCSSIVTHFELLFLTYGLLGGIGQAVCYSGAYVVVGFYFDKLRSLATGIIVSGFALGQIIHPIMVQKLLENYGLHGTFLLLGGVGFQSCVLGALVRPHPLELERRKKINPKSSFSLSYTFYKLCQSIVDYLRILRNLSFLTYCFSIVCWASSLGIFTLYITEYYYATGSSLAEASLITSLIGIGSIMSRMMMGLAAIDSSIDAKLLYFGSYGILTLLIMFLPLYGKYRSGKICCSLLYGLYSGGTWSLLSPITVEIVGIYNLATAFGIQMIAAGTGFIIGPDYSSVVMGSLQQCLYLQLCVYIYFNFNLIYNDPNGFALINSLITAIILYNVKTENTIKKTTWYVYFSACMTFLSCILGMFMTIFIPPSKPESIDNKADNPIEITVESDIQFKTVEMYDLTQNKFEKDETLINKTMSKIDFNVQKC